jgi:hypothetical protein
LTPTKTSGFQWTQVGGCSRLTFEEPADTLRATADFFAPAFRWCQGFRHSLRSQGVNVNVQATMPTDIGVDSAEGDDLTGDGIEFAVARGVFYRRGHGR